MRKYFLFTLFVLLMQLPINSFALNRVALVVGNEAYEGSAALNNPVNDSRAITKTLTEIGFDDVISVENVNKSDFEAATNQFYKIAKQADVALFFYSGHAIQWQGKNYMIPVGASLTDERDIKQLMPLDSLVEDTSSARHLGLVILDACRSNPFLDQLGEKSRGASRVSSGGIAMPSGVPGTFISYATQANAVAYDGASNHSPYTEALLKHLPTPNKDISLVFRAVRDEVAAATDWKQQPFTYSSIGGDSICLVQKEGESCGGGGGSNPPPRVPPPGMTFFTVDAQPADARVRILKPQTAYAPGMVLPTGQVYEVMVSRAGFRAMREQITMSDNSETRHSVRLEQVGDPGSSPSPAAPIAKLALNVQQSTGGKPLAPNRSFEAQLKKRLQSDNIPIVAADSASKEYIAEVELRQSVSFDKTFSTYNANCSAQLALRPAGGGMAVAEELIGLDPVGGYSQGEVLGECHSKLLPRISNMLVKIVKSIKYEDKKVVKTLALTVNNVDGGNMLKLLSIIENLSEVSASSAPTFDQGALTLQVDYQGEVVTLVKSLFDSGQASGVTLVLDTISESSLSLALSH